MVQHRHVIVRGLGKASESFEPYGGGSTERPSPVANRGAHAGRLRGDLGRLADEAKTAREAQAEAGVPKKNRGVTVAVTARPTEDLAVGSSLRANSRGMQLLNVQRRAGVNGGRGQDRAVYYVSSTAIEALERQLLGYEGWEESEPDEEAAWDTNEPEINAADRRPRNFWLFESAESFRVATIEDLWTDEPDSFPREKGAIEWEIWVRSSMRLAFEAAVEQLDVEVTAEPSEFVDILVYNGATTKSKLAKLIARSAAVVELRGASSFIAEHRDLPPTDRLDQIRSIAKRVVPAPPGAPWVSLLDTGVNPASALLAPALPRTRCRVAASAWDPFDADGHGTMMAGVALYGDLGTIAPGSSAIHLDIALESIAVFDPGSTVRIPARTAIHRGVVRAEQDDPHLRVYCLAATAVGEPEDGRPGATSGTLDDLAFNNGIKTRLFCVAVGNVTTTALQPYQMSSYASLNKDHGIQSPAQALNVLSVGAATNKCSGPAPVATAGGLSPRSRTAQAWDGKTHKPDILMEGGNYGRDPDGKTSRPHGPDMIATTSKVPDRITLTGDTSAACAAAARLAARVMARYPAMRAETVRGLLAHCADWTPTMWARHQAMMSKGLPELDATLATLDCFGWGVPNEERVFWSASNAVTLIAEDELRPYKRDDGKGVTLKEMKAFRLPWPDVALQALGATEIELRCTLSYFVQPDPHSAGLDRRQLYPSHGLKFDFQRFEETEARALRRVNKAIKTSDPNTDDNGWLLGRKKRPRGTLHHDVWRGPAYQLVGRRMINVTPIRGWWGSSSQIEPQDVPVRFSLIVSIRTPETKNDLVVEMRNAVPANLLVDVPSLIKV